MAGKSRWLLAVAAVLNFACSMANASPPIKVWWAEPYGTGYANGQGPMYSTPQQACSHFDGNWGPEYTYRYVYPPEPGHLWYWCEPLINGQPMAPGYARNVRGKYIGQKELCIATPDGWKRKPATRERWHLVNVCFRGGDDEHQRDWVKQVEICNGL